MFCPYEMKTANHDNNIVTLKCIFENNLQSSATLVILYSNVHCAAWRSAQESDIVTHITQWQQATIYCVYELCTILNSDTVPQTPHCKASYISIGPTFGKRHILLAPLMSGHSFGRLNKIMLSNKTPYFSYLC